MWNDTYIQAHKGLFKRKSFPHFQIASLKDVPVGKDFRLNGRWFTKLQYNLAQESDKNIKPRIHFLHVFKGSNQFLSVAIKK